VPDARDSAGNLTRVFAVVHLTEPYLEIENSSIDAAKETELEKRFGGVLCLYGT